MPHYERVTLHAGAVRSGDESPHYERVTLNAGAVRSGDESPHYERVTLNAGAVRSGNELPHYERVTLNAGAVRSGNELPHYERGMRFLVSGPADGFTNMAVDEAILLAHAAGEVAPTLRLYAWEPPAISIGYFQRARRDIDLEACARAGVDVVRRLTGGRGVLHADEVTYSVVVTEKAFEGAGVLDAYRVLSGGLVAGLRRLGLEASLAPGQRAHRGPSGADCFAAAAQCDLVVGGRKICGSAQVRRDGVILQHGALPLSLRDPSPFWREPGPPPNATDLTRALGRRPEWDEVADALAAGFAEALGVPLEQGALTTAEADSTARLRRGKYSTDAWNLRR